MTEQHDGDHDHSWDVDSRFIASPKEAQAFARFLKEKLNSGWQISGISFTSTLHEGSVFATALMVRDMAKPGRRAAKSTIPGYRRGK